MSENEEILNSSGDLQSEATSSGEGAQERVQQENVQDGAAEPAADGDVSRALAAAKEEIQHLKEEIQGRQDKYLRLAAEFENYKRLSQREQREQARFANEAILKELLPILDNLERALSCAGDRCAGDSKGGDPFIQGIELTLKQFHETLGKFGVQPVAGLGERFDPSCHQAVEQQESSTAPENTIVALYQKGYFLHDRLLRAAMVAVATASAESGRGNGVNDAAETGSMGRPGDQA